MPYNPTPHKIKVTNIAQSATHLNGLINKNIGQLGNQLGPHLFQIPKFLQNFIKDLFFLLISNSSNLITTNLQYIISLNTNSCLFISLLYLFF